LAAAILRPDDTALFSSLSSMGEGDRNLVLDALIRRVILPYSVVAIILFLLGLIVRYSPLPEINTEHENETIASRNANKKNIFEFPHLILGALAIFLHVGTQVIAVDTIIGYANSMGIGLLEAKAFPSYTLMATICGYLTGILIIPRFLSQLRALQICTLLGSVLTLLIIFTKGQVNFLGHTAEISIWFVVLLGLANSLVWAGIWPLALDGLGRYTKLGASVLIMGLCGNAILPLIYGRLADAYSVQLAYWILFPCYLYLVYYAFIGWQVKHWQPGIKKI
jgi:fucose permease